MLDLPVESSLFVFGVDTLLVNLESIVHLILVFNLLGHMSMEHG